MSACSPEVVDVAADVLVVGSGVAGLTAALDAADRGLRVLVVTRCAIGDGSTSWAQGGVAAVTAMPVPGDNLRLHARDTLTAGAGLCEPDAVSSILAEGSDAMADLFNRGAVFDTDQEGALRRTREGGHSAARVLRAGGDATGAEISRALVARARSRGVVVLERLRVVALRLDGRGRVAGAEAVGPGGERLVLPARTVVLATGGLGRLFARTTNPPVATGDGIALALRAGAEVSDLEFVQFHPTALAVAPGPDGSVPLVTEAVRGEGGVLVQADGRPLMAGVHPDRDLAPRDVVALAITRYLHRTGQQHVGLDARGISGFATRFPTVAGACRRAGVDPARDLIPVAPAAHYLCGGVCTDLAGRSTVPGLYAVGEVARTGLHGANRLASNSLLEGLVMGRRVARCIARELDGIAGRRSEAAAVEAALVEPMPVDPVSVDPLQVGPVQVGPVQVGPVQVGSAQVEAQVDMAMIKPIRTESRRSETRPGHGAARAAAARVGAARLGAADQVTADRIRASMSAHLGVGRDATGLEVTAILLRRAAGEVARRDREGLELSVLTATAMVAAARRREESRGCHQRTDCPGPGSQWQLSTAWRLADRNRDGSLEESRPRRGRVPLDRPRAHR